MYVSNCYNFEALTDWLRRNLIADETAKFSTSADYLARNYSRLKWNVTEQDVIEAMKIIGFKCEERDGQHYYQLKYDCPARAQFWTTYN